MKLILASNSPRRAELLRNAGFEFEIIPSNIEEGEQRPGETPEYYAQRLARAKALHVAAGLLPGSLVLGADTIVTKNGQVLGKPSDSTDAARMLSMLSNQTHQVTTAICLVRAPGKIEALKYESTLVTFRALDQDEISAYVASGEPFDKAGGYGVQGLASRFVTGIAGCYFNVVGLPVPSLYETLKALPEMSADTRNRI